MNSKASKEKQEKSFPPVMTLGRWFRRKLGFSVRKLCIDAGFTCPNRDGKKGRGGCAFCNNEAFAPGFRLRKSPIREQVAIQREKALQRGFSGRFLAYFQAYTNTYASVYELRRSYDEALRVSEDIIGLSVGTRPDCVSDEVLDLLESYTAAGKHVWLELGLQTIHDEKAGWMNRLYGRDDFDDAVSRAKGRGIFLCAHLIFGLPDETPEEMLESAAHVAELGLDGVKFHQLEIVRGTALEQRYVDKPFPLPSEETYAKWVADAIELLPEGTAVHRVAGFTPPPFLIAPRWESPPSRILAKVEAELRGRRGGR